MVMQTSAPPIWLLAKSLHFLQKWGDTLERLLHNEKLKTLCSVKGILQHSHLSLDENLAKNVRIWLNGTAGFSPVKMLRQNSSIFSGLLVLEPMFIILFDFSRTQNVH